MILQVAFLRHRPIAIILILQEFFRQCNIEINVKLQDPRPDLFEKHINMHIHIQISTEIYSLQLTIVYGTINRFSALFFHIVT